MANKTDKQMVTGVFLNPLDAQVAHDRVLALGYTRDEINVLMSDTTRTKYFSDKDRATTGNQGLEGSAVGGAIGTAVGATLAAIAAIGTSVAIPGLGLIIAGPIAAALAGAGAGAVTGGLLGGLIGLGIPESNAHAYEQALRNGGVVLGVTIRDSKDTNPVRKIFEEEKAENIVTTNS